MGRGKNVRSKMEFSLLSLSTQLSLSQGCRTAVEHTPHNQKIVGSNPPKCWFFLLSFPTFLHQRSVLNQVPQGGASLTVCWERHNEFLAVLHGGETGSNQLRFGIKKIKSKNFLPTRIIVCL